MTNKRVFIIAGEASGDLLGAGLMKELKNLLPRAEFAGVGGEEMARAGLKSLFNIRDIAVMGIFEVLSHLRLIRRRLAETILAAKAFRPDVIITIDSPGFTGRVARALKGVAPLVHYVAPSVWAYREGRAKKLAKTHDMLLCFFEFERPYFEKYGLKTIAVGHPLGAEIKPVRAAHKGKRVVMLAGSRRSFAERLLPIYKKVAERFEGAKFVLPAASTNADQIRAGAKGWAEVAEGKAARYRAYARADAAVAISGTGALELALSGVPTVVVYKAAPLTFFIGRLLLKIKNVSLPNIILGREMARELLQGAATADAIARELSTLLGDKRARVRFSKDSAELRGLLARRENPSGAAAKAVAKLLSGRYNPCESGDKCRRGRKN